MDPESKERLTCPKCGSPGGYEVRFMQGGLWHGKSFDTKEEALDYLIEGERSGDLIAKSVIRPGQVVVNTDELRQLISQDEENDMDSTDQVKHADPPQKDVPWFPGGIEGRRTGQVIAHVEIHKAGETYDVVWRDQVGTGMFGGYQELEHAIYQAKLLLELEAKEGDEGEL